MKGKITMNFTKRIMSAIPALIIATSVLPISAIAITYDKNCSSLESDNINIYHYDTNLPSVFTNEIDAIVNSYLHQFPEFRDEIAGTADAITSTENFIELFSIDSEKAVELFDYKINDLNGTVTIVDPFNSSVCGGSSSFGGTHTVTYDELLGAIIGNSDSWI